MANTKAVYEECVEKKEAIIKPKVTLNLMKNNDTFYVTTPIYYVTAKPHLGSLYSTVLADIAARWNKLLGKETFFLTGTDEHGQKVAQAAEKAGKPPKEFVDSFIADYRDVWQKFGIDYSYFIRTTDENHVKAVQDWLRQLKEKGDIYKSMYQGWYCVPDETFVLEKESSDQSENEGPLCPSCGRPTVEVVEEAYFFRLSAYQDRLLEFYEKNPDFIVPKERLHEVISFVKSGLKDLSISRTTITWGIPFPDDTKHVTYVWADALNNYITAIGYAQPGKEHMFYHWWPANLQILGKDIIRFHAVYWPAFLMASGLALPKRLLVHGWIKVDKQKMSKSLGNVIDPLALYTTYGAEPVRYYLAKMAITHDSEFSIEDLEQKISSELADDLGNLLNRMISLAHKHAIVEVPLQEVWSEVSLNLKKEGVDTINEFNAYMQENFYYMALARLWKFIKSVNGYFHGLEPWKLANNDKDYFIQVISATAHSLRLIATLLWPVMPKTAERIFEGLGKEFVLVDNMIEALAQDSWSQQFSLKKIPMLFEKPITKEIGQEQHEQNKGDVLQNQPAESVISIDDLVKIQLMVGTIEQCEALQNSEKMLKMHVNFGSNGMRQILAGIKQSYNPDELINKQAVFVFNLAPRKMMGLESQGMLLVAPAEDGTVKITTPAGPVPNGTCLR